MTINPPEYDEFELSLFGPGVGECIVVHLGEGEWAVVDSCLNPRAKEPVALSYLKSLGLDVGRSVRLVVVTHWHDDHMEGVATLLQHATNAVFCISIALRKDEFLSVAAQASDLMASSSDVAPSLRIFQILKQRKASRSSAPFGSVKFAQETHEFSSALEVQSQ